MIYEQYLLCRSTQLVIFRKPVKGKKDGSEKIVIVVWPTGLTQLPIQSGVGDQAFLDTRLLASALRGEQNGVARLIEKA
jgi:hypothetical protein